MRKILPLVLVLFILTSALKTDKPAYRIFDLKGKNADYGDVLKSAMEADIIFFGELHNSPICHWLELELAKDIYAEKNENLLLGMEMFESDNQLILNEYLEGKVREKNFEDESKLWDNYKTDYKPLVKFAFENKIPVIATNVPRRYASLVNKKGFTALDSLSDAAKSYLPPLPIAYDSELKGYKDLVEMMKEAGGHDTLNIARAQATKDATMAYFILQNWKEGKVFIHYNGTYHSDNFEGIVWYVKQAMPDLKIMTISSIEQDDLDTLAEENKNLADFTLCIPTSMSKSY